MRDDFLLGLINPIITLIFSVTFLVFWSRDKERCYTLKIALSYFLMGIGFLSSHLIPIKFTLLNITTTNTIFACAAICLVYAVNERVGKKTALKEMFMLSGIGISISFIFQLTSPTLNLTLLTTNLSIGTIFAIGAWQIKGNLHKGGIERAIFWLFFLVAAQFIFRPILSLALSGDIIPSNYRQSEYWLITNFTAALFSVISAMIFIAACTNDFIQQIKDISNTDLLTGLKIRKAFDEETQQLLAKHKRTPLPLTLIISDIDHFKNVNDTYGHQCGDMVIANFGKLISTSLRQSDLAGRIGGEEFCVILWNANQAGGVLVAENLRSTFNNSPIEKLPSHERFSASFGVASYQNNETFDEWFARADKALYEAKKTGRNCVVGHKTPPQSTTTSTSHGISV